MIRESPSLSPPWAGHQQQQTTPAVPAAAAADFTSPFSVAAAAAAADGTSENAAAATTGQDASKGFDNIWEHISSPQATNGGQRRRRLSFQLSLVAPVSMSQANALGTVPEQHSFKSTDGKAATTPAEAILEQEAAHGHSGVLEQLLDEALGQLQTEQPAAAAAAAVDGIDVEAVRSHRLPDQGPVTSPARPPLYAQAPGLLPEGAVAAGYSVMESVVPAVDDTAVTTDASLAGVTGTARALKPIASMRLFSIMSPKWQYNQELQGMHSSRANAVPATGAYQQQNGNNAGASPLRSNLGVRGLWPTMSFKLAPVRLQQPVEEQHVHQPTGTTAW